MANSKFQYVHSFENYDKLEPLQWIVLKVKHAKGKNLVPTEEHSSEFHLQFHSALSTAACSVMKNFKDLSLSYSYGHSCNFVFSKQCSLFKRRGFKLLTNVCSLFSSSFVLNWSKFLSPHMLNISVLPLIEGSIYLLPNDQCLRDYLTSEQYKCHQENLVCTTVRNLVNRAGFKYNDAMQKVSVASESEKNELLFSLCNINYNNENVKLKKGSILLYQSDKIEALSNKNCDKQDMTNERLIEVQEDFCKDIFWNTRFLLRETRHCSTNIITSFKRTYFILPHSWMIVRIDGKKFRNFADKHQFKKPNDLRALRLMTSSAKVVMKKFPSVILSYGQSDEYSFVFQRYNNHEKDGYSVSSRTVSLFSSAFTYFWDMEFKTQPMLYLPSFDARVVLYPTNSSLRDYLSWRQVDCHINNLYNTCFWKLIEQKGLTNNEAEGYLKGTLSENKFDILENELGIKYSLENPIFCKGTILYSTQAKEDEEIDLIEESVDFIRDEFWLKRPWLLGEELKPKGSLGSKGAVPLIV